MNSSEHTGLYTKSVRGVFHYQPLYMTLFVSLDFMDVRRCGKLGPGRARALSLQFTFAILIVNSDPSVPNLMCSPVQSSVQYSIVTVNIVLASRCRC